MMRELILTLKDELKEKLYRDIWRRNIVLPRVEDKIHVITGMRRTGKSFFLIGLIKDLLQDGLEETKVLYVNFEDDRLLPMKQLEFARLIETFYELYPENHQKECYFFFDEIQNIEGWQTVIRRIFDSKKVKIFITGSSAKMLSREIATSLRGRSINTEMWPLDFFEYPNRKIYPAEMSKMVSDQFQKDFHEYMLKGGFPEVIFYEPSARVRVLQDYVEIVVFRDIIERYNVSNITLIKYLIKTILHSASRQISIHKLYNDLKSQGIKVGKNTLYEYIGYIEDCYLAFMVPIYSESIRTVQSNPKKVYAIDTGLIKAFTLKKEDYGNLFENIVYIGLRRLGYEISFYLTKERYEVDFLVKDIFGNRKLFQVCYDIKDKNTFHREQRALDVAKKELSLEGEIVTPFNYVKVMESLKKM
ncbi:MAG: ATP-binding protein [Leptospiraceae bacterium]|nr:ATP-binding protein [Leptospiraceae bacterium]MCP5494440.1 ATP-binding protein [Leptospiraceae bacterium]